MCGGAGGWGAPQGRLRRRPWPRPPCRPSWNKRWRTWTRSAEMSCARPGYGRWRVLPQDPSLPSLVPSHFPGLDSSSTPTPCLSVRPSAGSRLLSGLHSSAPFPSAAPSASSEQSFEHQPRGAEGRGHSRPRLPRSPSLCPTRAPLACGRCAMNAYRVPASPGVQWATNDVTPPHSLDARI